VKTADGRYAIAHQAAVGNSLHASRRAINAATNARYIFLIAFDRGHCHFFRVKAIERAQPFSARSRSAIDAANDIAMRPLEMLRNAAILSVHGAIAAELRNCAFHKAPESISYHLITCGDRASRAQRLHLHAPTPSG
jgi:hypothetical protein